MFQRFHKLRQHSKKVSVGYLASLPANYIDELDKENNESLLRKGINWLKTRVVYALFFIPLLSIDVISTFFIAIALSVRGLFSSDRQLKKTAENYRDHALKNMLSFSMSWVGLLISPKLISFFFIENNLKDHQMLSGGKLYEREVTIKKVSKINSTKEIADILLNADGAPVSIRGAGFSQGEQFLPDKSPKKEARNKQPIVIDLSDINHVEILDKKSKTLRVGAGATWAEVQNFANKHKMALKVMQASNVFSVGGSIGTNIHGWDHKNGTVANTIRAVTVINPKGEVHTYYRGKHPEFNQVFGTFGLMGVITEVHLELTDNEKLYERATEVLPDDYLKEFEGVQENPNIRMHLYRLSLEQGKLLQTGLMVNYVKEDLDPPVKSRKLRQEDTKGRRFERIGINLIRRSHFFQSKYWAMEKHRLLTQTDKDACQTTNEIMQPVINAMLNASSSETEWLQEYFIPGDQLTEFLRRLGQLLDENNVHMINATVRYVKKDEISPLPYAPEERFAVVICFNQILKPKEVAQTERWVKLASNIALNAGGAPYMPYQSFVSQTQYEKAYGTENIQQLRLQKEAIDPNNRLCNGFYHKYLKPRSIKVDNIFEKLMGSEENQKAFRGFLTNILCRADADKFFALLRDITAYSDTYEDVYQQLQERMTECMPGTFRDLGNIISSLSHIKTDLIEQASSLLGEKNTIDGMLEIGYPGRFISEFQKQYTLKGNRYVMLEAESPTDYIQTGFPRPYSKAFYLNYSDPVASMNAYLEKAGENSVEVITCFVGLHHFPEDELDPFLKKIHRALKPGGHFLLVDHNIECERDNLMAKLAHSVFNIITGESLKNDVNELRNFQPMTHWETLCAKHDLGISISRERKIRQGDPTKNQMCAFTKSNIEPQFQSMFENSVEIMSDQQTEKPLREKVPEKIKKPTGKGPSQGFFEHSKTQLFKEEYSPEERHKPQAKNKGG